MVNKGDDSKQHSNTGSGIAGAEGADSTQISTHSAAISAAKRPRVPGPFAGQGRGANFRRPVEERHRVAARKLVAGAPVLPTLVEAGYSQHVAEHGVQAVARSGPLRQAMIEALEPMADAPIFPSDKRRNIVVNKLLNNIMLNRDSVTTSLTTLARIEGMLQPETQVGIVITSLPEDTGAGKWADAGPPEE